MTSDSVARAEGPLLELSRIKSDSAYCNKNIGAARKVRRVEEVCRGVYYCSDGGCIPEWFAVIADKSKEDSLFGAVSDLPVRKFARCAEMQEIYPAAADIWSVPERGIPIPNNIQIYCGYAISGFENDVVTWLRARTDIAYWAKRFGEGAGSPPAFVSVSSEVFYSIRGGGMGTLKKTVEDGLSEMIGLPCETNRHVTCSVSVGNGRIVADLLAPSTGMSGRHGVWEKSHWEIYPNQMFTDMFSITIDLPVTSIRRWPSTSEKPGSGFTSLDYDDGFEVLRNHLARRISEHLGGQVEDFR